VCPPGSLRGRAEATYQPVIGQRDANGLRHLETNRPQLQHDPAVDVVCSVVASYRRTSVRTEYEREQFGFRGDLGGIDRVLEGETALEHPQVLRSVNGHRFIVPFSTGRVGNVAVEDRPGADTSSPWMWPILLGQVAAAVTFDQSSDAMPRLRPDAGSRSDVFSEAAPCSHGRRMSVVRDMIMSFGSRQDYDAIAGQSTGKPAPSQ
jgi:hypothetical protein